MVRASRKFSAGACFIACLLILPLYGAYADAQVISTIEDSWEQHSIVVADLALDSGFAWDAHLDEILEDGCMAGRPSLMVDRGGTLWLCWVSDHMVYVASRERQDSHWRTQSMIVDDGWLLDEPHMCQGPGDVYWLVYSGVSVLDLASTWAGDWMGSDVTDETITEPSGRIFVVSSVDGVDWSDPVEVASDNNVDNANPWVAWGLDRLWIVWDSDKKSGNRDLWMTRSDDGSVWDPPTAILPDDDNDRDPALAFAHGTAHLTWTSDVFDIYGHAGDQAEDLVVHSMSTDGYAWSTPAPVHQRYCEESSPSLCIDVNGDPFLVWSSDRSLHTDMESEKEHDLNIWYSLFQEEGWTLPTPLTFGSGHDSTPTVVHSGAGYYVIWERGDRLLGTSSFSPVFIHQLRARIAVSDLEWRESFDDSYSGTIAKTFVVGNIGNIDLEGTLSWSEGFTCDKESLLIRPGENQSVTISLNTVEPGEYVGTLVIDSNDDEFPQTVIMLQVSIDTHEVERPEQIPDGEVVPEEDRDRSFLLWYLAGIALCALLLIALMVVRRRMRGRGSGGGRARTDEQEESLNGVASVLCFYLMLATCLVVPMNMVIAAQAQGGDVRITDQEPKSIYIWTPYYNSSANGESYTVGSWCNYLNDTCSRYACEGGCLQQRVEVPYPVLGLRFNISSSGGTVPLSIRITDDLTKRTEWYTVEHGEEGYGWCSVDLTGSDITNRVGGGTFTVSISAPLVDEYGSSKSYGIMTVPSLGSKFPPGARPQTDRIPHIEVNRTNSQWFVFMDKECSQPLADSEWMSTGTNLMMELNVRATMFRYVYLDHQVYGGESGDRLQGTGSVVNPFADEEDFILKIAIVGPDGMERTIHEMGLSIPEDRTQDFNFSYAFPDDLTEGKYYVVGGIYLENPGGGGEPIMLAKWGGSGESMGVTSFSYAEDPPIKSVELVDGARTELDEGKRYVYYLACEDAPGLDTTIIDNTRMAFEALGKGLGVDLVFRNVTSTRDFDELVNSDLKDAIVVNAHGEVLPIPESFTRGEHISDDAVAIYRFDEANGTRIFDRSKYLNDGTFVGDPEWAWDCHEGISALSFDGVHDMVKVENHSSLQNPSLTVDFWVALDANYTEGTHTVLAYEGENTGWAFSLEGEGEFAAPNRIAFSVGDGHVRHVLYGGPVPMGGWHRITGVFDGKTAFLYVDNILKDRRNVTVIEYSSAPLTVGGSYLKRDQFTKMRVDDVVISTDARAPTATVMGDPQDGVNWIKRVGRWIAESGITFVNVKGCPFNSVGNMDLRWKDDMMWIGSAPFQSLLVTRCADVGPLQMTTAVGLEPTGWVDEIKTEVGDFDAPASMGGSEVWSLPAEFSTFCTPLYLRQGTSEISHAIIFYGLGAIMLNGAETCSPELVAAASLWWMVNRSRPLYIVACEDSPSSTIPSSVVEETEEAFDAVAEDLGITFHYKVVDNTDELERLVGSSMEGVIVVNAHGEVLPLPKTYINGSAVVEGTCAMYKLEQGQGTTVLDGSPGRFDGVISGATWDSDPSFGEHALRFDGEDDYVIVGRNPQLSPDTFTVELSVRLGRDYSDDAATILSNELLTGAGPGPRSSMGFSLEVDPFAGARPLTNCLVLTIGSENGPRERLVSGVSLEKDLWHRVRASYDGSAMRLYVDYIEVANKAASGLRPNSALGLYVGAAPSDGTATGGPVLNINATIDDISIYAGERSPDQMQLDTVAWDRWVERIVDWTAQNGIIWTELSGKGLRFVGLEDEGWPSDMLPLPEIGDAGVLGDPLPPLCPDLSEQTCNRTALGDEIAAAFPHSNLPADVTSRKNVPISFDLPALKVYANERVVSHELVAIGNGFFVHSGSYVARIAPACAAWAYSRDVHMTYFLNVPSTVLIKQPPQHPIESEHDYPNDFNGTWNVTIDGAMRLRVHFEKVEVETSDLLEVLDGNNDVIASYSDEEDVWSPWVEGDTLRIHLWSDRNVFDYGFKVDLTEHLEVREDTDPIDADEVGRWIDRLTTDPMDVFVYKEVRSTGDFEWLVNSKVGSPLIVNLRGNELPVPDSYLERYYKGMVLTATLAQGSSGTGRVYYTFSNKSYELRVGDVLEYDIMLDSTNPTTSCAGVSLFFDDDEDMCAPGSGADPLVDQNGISATPGTDIGRFAKGTWYHRMIEIPSTAWGRRVTSWDISCTGSVAGTYTIYVDNVRIVSDGKVRMTAYEDVLVTCEVHENMSNDIFTKGYLDSQKDVIVVKKWIDKIADWIASSGAVLAFPDGYPLWFGVTDGKSDRWRIGESGWDELLSPRCEKMLVETGPEDGFIGEMTQTARLVNEVTGYLPGKARDVPIAIPDQYDCIAFYTEPTTNGTTHGIIPFGRGAVVFSGAYYVDILAAMCTMYAARHDQLMFFNDQYYKGSAIRTKVVVRNDMESERTYSIGLVVTFSAEGLRSQQLMDDLKVTLKPGEERTIHLMWTPSHRVDIGSYKLEFLVIDCSLVQLVQRWGNRQDDDIVAVQLMLDAYISGISTEEYYSYFETLTFGVTIVNEMYMDLDFAISGMFINTDSNYGFWTDIQEHRVDGLSKSEVRLQWSPSDQNYENQTFVAGAFKGTVCLEDAASTYYVPDTSQTSERAKYVRKATYLDQGTMTFTILSEIEITFPQDLGTWEVCLNGDWGPNETIDPAVRNRLRITDPDADIWIRKGSNVSLPDEEKDEVDDATCFLLRYVANSGDVLYASVNAGNWERNQDCDWNETVHAQKMFRIPGDGNPLDRSMLQAYYWEAGTVLVISRKPVLTFGATDCAFLHNRTPGPDPVNVASVKETVRPFDCVVLRDTHEGHGSAVTYAMELNEANFYTLSLTIKTQEEGPVKLRIHFRYHTGDPKDKDTMNWVGYRTCNDSLDRTMEWESGSGYWDTRSIKLMLPPQSYLLTLEFVSEGPSGASPAQNAVISRVTIQPHSELPIETGPSKPSIGGSEEGGGAGEESRSRADSNDEPIGTSTFNGGYVPSFEGLGEDIWDALWLGIYKEIGVPCFSVLGELNGAKLPFEFSSEAILNINMWQEFNETTPKPEKMGVRLILKGDIPIPEEMPVIELTYEIEVMAEYDAQAPGDDIASKTSWETNFFVRIGIPIGRLFNPPLDFDKELKMTTPKGDKVTWFELKLRVFLDLSIAAGCKGTFGSNKVTWSVGISIGLRLELTFTLTLDLKTIVKDLKKDNARIDKDINKLEKEEIKNRNNLDEWEEKRDTKVRALKERYPEWSDDTIQKRCDLQFPNYKDNIDHYSKGVSEAKVGTIRMNKEKRENEDWLNKFILVSWVPCPKIELKISIIVGAYFGLRLKVDQVSDTIAGLVYGELFFTARIDLTITLFSFKIFGQTIEFKLDFILAFNIDKIFWINKMGNDEFDDDGLFGRFCFEDRAWWKEHDEEAFDMFIPNPNIEPYSGFYVKIWGMEVVNTPI